MTEKTKYQLIGCMVLCRILIGYYEYTSGLLSVISIELYTEVDASPLLYYLPSFLLACVWLTWAHVVDSDDPSPTTRFLITLLLYLNIAILGVDILQLVIHL